MPYLYYYNVCIDAIFVLLPYLYYYHICIDAIFVLLPYLYWADPPFEVLGENGSVSLDTLMCGLEMDCAVAYQRQRGGTANWTGWSAAYNGNKMGETSEQGKD